MSLRNTDDASQPDDGEAMHRPEMTAPTVALKSQSEHEAANDAPPPFVSIVVSPPATSGAPKSSGVRNAANSAKSTKAGGSANAATAPRDPSAPSVRRERSWWMKHPNVMIAAAIVAGALAAVVISQIVLWLVRPAPSRFDYGAKPTPSQCSAERG